MTSELAKGDGFNKSESRCIATAIFGSDVSDEAIRNYIWNGAAPDEDFNDEDAVAWKKITPEMSDCIDLGF